MTRPRARTAALLAAALLLTGCGDDDDTVASAEGAVVEETTSTSPPSTGATPDGPTSTTQAEPAGTVLEITVTGGEVQGGGRTSVALGEEVTIRVTSDVDDHVHLHGYDVLVDVVAGQPAELVFTADIPGVFEVELEDARIPLAELEIS